jgi:hypothetical protein
MKNYRNVSQSFWNDSKVDDDFSPEDKYFMLYLLTNPHTSVCGCYEISMKQMERETGYNTDTIARLISRMQDVHKVIKYDQETKEVLIINWHKYNWTKSEKLMKAVVSGAEHIKSEEFKRYVMHTVTIRYGYPIDTSDKDNINININDNINDNENDICADKPRTRTRFTPPTVEEVAAYCQERGNKVNPQQFVDFYASKGWIVGKSPMKDWKAAIRSTWEREERQQSRAAPAKHQANSSIDMSDVERIMNPYGGGIP